MPRTPKEIKENLETQNKNGQQTPTMSPYEQSREDRIKENLQRMQKLGIVDLSQKLNSAVRPKRTPKHSHSDSPRSTPVPPSRPPRRSSRLQNATPVSYSEVVMSRKDKGLEDNDVKLEEGSKPEVYTEEHEKLLGSTERSWTFFVDGYGEDGRRIYDPVKGKTCHQCRQKTLGHRTQCSECNKVQGQFCGDCLYMRYGEHVLEALENSNWVCPVCRGICNCSLCRQAKGWYPTGPLYKKISRLGFKSVAHYLIQTQRAQTNLEMSPDTVTQASAKRSLSFSEKEEALSKDSAKVNENQLEALKPQSEDRKDDDDLNTEKENNMQVIPVPSTNHQTSTRGSLPFSNIEEESQGMDSIEIDLKVQNHFELSHICALSAARYIIQTQRAQTNPEKSPDTVTQASARRLPSFSEKETLSKDSAKVNENHLRVLKPQSEDRKNDDDSNIEKENNMQLILFPSTNHQTYTRGSLPFSNIEEDSQGMDSIEVELKVQNHFELSHPQVEDKSDDLFKGEHYTDNDSNIALESCTKSIKKRSAVEPSPDRVAGRLRQRHRKGNDHDDIELPLVSEKSLDIKLALSNTSDCTPKLVNKPAVDAELDNDSKARISQQMEMEEVKMNQASSTNPGPQSSIARRLRPRNKTA